RPWGARSVRRAFRCWAGCWRYRGGGSGPLEGGPVRPPPALLSRVTLLVALAAAGAAGASRHATTFKYCTDPTFPPMELASPSGAISGFDVDMAVKLAATWGGVAKPVKTAFPGLIPALNAKRCDAAI